MRQTQVSIPSRTAPWTGWVRRRGPSLAVVVIVMTLAAMAQGSISYTFAFGALRGPLGLDFGRLPQWGYIARWCILAAMVALWALGKKQHPAPS